MDQLVEFILSIFPFTELLKGIGLKDERICATLAAVIIMVVLYFAYRLTKKLVNHIKDSRAAGKLLPYFTYKNIKDSRRYFITTQGQNHSPAHEEEPGQNKKFAIKGSLIPWFLNEAFNEKREIDKFYLILADSGMGKTTFLINLFMKYTSVLNFNKKYKIRLFPFGDSRILDEIKKINREEKIDTILLLDAFDEDKSLIPPVEPDGLSDEERFRRRIDEIMEVVQDFREVVITSRTQYFPGQEEKPYELKIKRYDEEGFHILTRLYLSLFDDREVKQYLSKKYGVVKFWNWKKKKRAATIVKNSPKLMVRPMLLSYIDWIVGDADKTYNNTYEIYDALVNKWLEQEGKKRKHDTNECEKFKQNLYTFSRLVALEIYRQRKHTNQLSLNKDAAVAISKSNNLDLCDYEITGQSLLTRDAEGNWKFAHKSIWEFFIAQEAAQNIKEWFIQDYHGMDMTALFLREKLPGMVLPVDFVHIKGGTFIMGSPESEAQRDEREIQHKIKVDDFYMSKYTVTLEQFEAFLLNGHYKFDGDLKGQKDKQHPVVCVSWYDAAAYCKWLSMKLNTLIRLPTEAEWEYACRAGTTTPFNTGDNLTTEQANYDGNYPYNNNPKGAYIKKTTPVGHYKPNDWGLFDMHGNVLEWCNDRYDEDYYVKCRGQVITENPQGSAVGSLRVLRGGSWFNYGQICRSAFRYGSFPDFRYNIIGFRLVCAPQSSGSRSITRINAKYLNQMSEVKIPDEYIQLAPLRKN